MARKKTSAEGKSARRRMGSKRAAELEAEYSTVIPTAQRLSEELEAQFTQLLADQGITLSVPIQHRVKKWPSIKEKLERKSVMISKVTDLGDLVGLRLILLFQRDIARVCSLIEERFVVVERQDTHAHLREDQFGYASIHYVVELQESWLSVPTLAAMRGMRAEIQVRTTAQHIWAAASHALQYKHEESVPLPVRRAIHRVSALLETIDLEFERVLSERADYREQLVGLPAETELNVDTLERTLDDLLPLENKRVGQEEYASLVSELSMMGITTVGGLRRVLEKHREALMEREKENVKVGGRDDDDDPHEPPDTRPLTVYFMHTGFVRVALEFEYGDAWRKAMEQ